MHHRERFSPSDQARKYRRFDLRLPVSLSFPSKGTFHELRATSENVSLGGLLLRAADEVPLRTQVSLTLNVVGPLSRRPVLLSAQGEVVRVESLGTDGGFAIAVECKQPITEMGDHLPAGF
jgi:c-di-GMP-binding flagellar brake protein YcgR